jgi:hypothetical protein
VLLCVEGGIVPLYAETVNEMLDLAAEVMDTLLPQSSTDAGRFRASKAWFSLADGRTRSQHQPVSCLAVAVNRRTGHGGLIWTPEVIGAEQGSVWASVWVSDNAAPPETDPRVMSDPDAGIWFDPASALPLAHVRAAVEEFCRSGTGARPDCVGWVRGSEDGRRGDREYVDR